MIDSSSPQTGDRCSNQQCAGTLKVYTTRLTDNGRFRIRFYECNLCGSKPRRSSRLDRAHESPPRSLRRKEYAPLSAKEPRVVYAVKTANLVKIGHGGLARLKAHRTLLGPYFEYMAWIPRDRDSRHLESALHDYFRCAGLHVECSGARELFRVDGRLLLERAGRPEADQDAAAIAQTIAQHFDADRWHSAIFDYPGPVTVWTPDYSNVCEPIVVLGRPDVAIPDFLQEH